MTTLKISQELTAVYKLECLKLAKESLELASKAIDTQTIITEATKLFEFICK